MLVSWFVEYTISREITFSKKKYQKKISGEIFYASFGYNACPKHIDYMQWMNQQTILFIYLFVIIAH